jgi:hypothetical protein
MQQLDIFSDSLPVQRANALIAALAGFDCAAARQALSQLAEVTPNHAELPRYRQLCDFVEHWVAVRNRPDWADTPKTVAAEEQLLREQIIPAAIVMGNAGDALVRKCWGGLAQASEKIGIPPEHRDCFAAELYLRAQQFADAVRTAQSAPGGAMRAAVQRWLGLGFYGCGAKVQAKSAALRYAWLAPQRFDSFVAETGDVELARDWLDFQADLGDLDATWFPAWCAHEGKTDVAISDNVPASDGGMAYRLVIGLLIRERGGLGPDVYEDRKSLKRLNEIFFDFYMKRRS